MKKWNKDIFHIVIVNTIIALLICFVQDVYAECGINSQFDTKGWVGTKCSWTIDGGYYTTVVPPWAAGDAGCYAYYDEVFTNFTYEVRMRSVDQAYNGRIGVYFRGDPTPHSADPNRWESGYVFQIQQDRPDEGYCLIKYQGADTNMEWVVPWTPDSG